MDSESVMRFEMRLVSSTDSPDYALLTQVLARSSIIALDAEWKPVSQKSTFPTVSLLQLACQLRSDDLEGSAVFLLDLSSIPLASVWKLLSDVFVSPDVLKLGFRFQQDLIYLSSTFSSHGGFDRVEPYLDIASIYNHLQPSQPRKENKGLATICEEVLGFPLSKELQCSDWSLRPLTEAQKMYAACDVHCLLHIFKVFQAKVIKEEVQSMDETLSKVVKEYGEKILLQESDKKPRITKKKGKKGSSVNLVWEEKRLENCDEWQGPPPWDVTLGGNGCPKFLCDVTVKGLAKYLRRFGIDAANPPSEKPDPRELINQAQRESRVLLTRNARLLRHECAVKNQIYWVDSLLKNEQLVEVLITFQLKISVDQLMPRCTKCNGKCNGKFIQKPLSTEEAIDPAKGFQRLPSCVFDKNLKFWQCMDCNQLYRKKAQNYDAFEVTFLKRLIE